jgi:hypothetical protein
MSPKESGRHRKAKYLYPLEELRFFLENNNFADTFSRKSQ